MNCPLLTSGEQHPRENLRDVFNHPAHETHSHDVCGTPDSQLQRTIADSLSEWGRTADVPAALG